MVRLLLFVLLLLVTASAQAHPTDSDPGATESVDGISQEWNDRQPSDPYSEFGARLRAAAQRDPQSEEALKAHILLARSALRSDKPGAAEEALMEAARTFHSRPFLERYLTQMLFLAPNVTRPSAMWLADHSDLPTVREQALLLFAERLSRDDAHQAEEEALLERLREEAGPKHRALAEQALWRSRNLRKGQPAPPIEGAGLSGETVRVSDYRGKVVVVDFWGTWCSPCVEGMPKLAELRSRYPERLEIVGVSTGESPSQTKAMLKRHGYDWPQIWDGSPGKGPLCQTWDVQNFPTYVIIDEEGLIRYRGLQYSETLDGLLK